jgi:tellurite methyltransferase
MRQGELSMVTKPTPQSDREHWNRCFLESSHSSDVPDTFFVEAYQEYVNPLLGDSVSRQVLDVAAGAGRHGLWLAERAWTATLVDASDEGLALARRRARGRNLDVDFVERDLDQVTSAEAERWQGRFDLVLVFFYLQRSLFPALEDALKLGGLLLFKTYTTRQPQFGSGPSQRLHLLEPGELLRAFPSLKVLFYRETVRERGVAELVAQK